MTDKQPDTADVVIAGRTIKVRRPTGAQATLAHREGRIAQAALVQLESLEEEAEESEEAQELSARAYDGTAGVLDIMGRLVVNRADREWLIEGMKDGVIDVPDLEPILGAFVKDGKRAAKAKRVR